jgi:hypothetical protein
MTLQGLLTWRRELILLQLKDQRQFTVWAPNTGGHLTADAVKQLLLFNIAKVPTLNMKAQKTTPWSEERGIVRVPRPMPPSRHYVAATMLCYGGKLAPLVVAWWRHSGFGISILCYSETLRTSDHLETVTFVIFPKLKWFKINWSGILLAGITWSEILLACISWSET